MSIWWHLHWQQALAAGIAASLVLNLVVLQRLYSLRKRANDHSINQKALAWHHHRRMLLAMGVNPDDYTRLGPAPAALTGSWDSSGRYGPDRGSRIGTHYRGNARGGPEDPTAVLPYIPAGQLRDAGSDPRGDVVSTGEDGGRWFRIPDYEQGERTQASPVRPGGRPSGYS